MAANRRSPFEIERDRALITQRYLRRETQHEIAAALGISRDMVAYDLAVIQDQWRQSTTRNLDEDKARELSKIDELERTYWRAWEESQQDKEVTVQEQLKGTSTTLSGKALDRMKAQVRKEGQSGNPSFLAGIAWCIERRCKILGIDAPLKQDLLHDATNNVLDALRAFGAAPSKRSGSGNE